MKLLAIGLFAVLIFCSETFSLERGQSGLRKTHIVSFNLLFE